jgi:hypothetical protein
MWMRTPHSDGAIDAPSKHMQETPKMYTIRKALALVLAIGALATVATTGTAFAHDAHFGGWHSGYGHYGHWGYGRFYNYGVDFYPSCYLITKPWGVVKVCPDSY